MRRALAQLLIALSAGVAGVFALLPSQAAATFHGRNGLIAWSSDVSDGKAGGLFAIAILPVGQGRRHVIRSCSDVDADGNPIYCQQWDRVSFSPNGRRLMWDMLTTAGNWAIVLANSNGSAPHTIVQSSTESDSQPSFSPNGQRIVYVSGPLGSKGQIVTSNLAGGNVQVLTTTVTGYDPVWAPNGKTIVFVHNEDIWSVGVNGHGAPNRLSEQRRLRIDLRDALHRPHRRHPPAQAPDHGALLQVRAVGGVLTRWQAACVWLALTSLHAEP